MSNKLVALVITNLAGSGAEKIVLQLFNMFEKNNINTYIFLLEDVVSYNLTIKEKQKIVNLTKKRNIYKFFSFLGDKFLNRKFEKKLNEIEKKENKKFDLILSNSPSSDRVLYFSEGYNIYNVIHNSYQNEINEFHSRGMHKRALKKEKLYKKIYSDKNLITVSKKIIDDLNRLELKYKSICCIYNPFNFELLKQKSLEKRDDTYRDNYIINASAYRYTKRHDILLKAYKQLNIKEKLILLCKPFDGLINLIKELELEDKVEILGFQKNPYPFIKNAKLLVLSSEREGLPTVLIESLILGTPVVSTNCISGPSEILTGSLSEYLAEVNNVDDLASKIYKAVNENITIDKKELEKFSEDNIIKKYLNLIKE